MQQHTSKPRVWMIWVIIVCLTFQFLLGGGPSGSTVTSCHIQLPDLYEASNAELQEGLEHGHFTSVDLVKVPLVQLPSFEHSHLASRRLIFPA